MHTKFQHVFFAALLSVSLLPSRSQACDLCSIYAAQEIKDAQPESITTGVFEQFTSFNSLQNDGKHIDNTLHQSLSSSITQLYGRYDFSEILGVQTNIPFISRNFYRAEDGVRTSGNESGIGDIAILCLWSPVRVSDKDFFARATTRFGIELPTGDASRLREETEEEHDLADEESEHADSDEHSSRSMLAHLGHMHEAEVASGIHGHDIALGSGSFDYILGTGIFFEKGRFFSAADIQYALRTEGDFDYRYQNDLTWSLGAGGYLLTEHTGTLSLKANLSGEYKGMDVVDGVKATDTGVNSMFLGPEFNFTVAESLCGLLGLDLPLFVDNTDIQAVPDYRIRVGLIFRF